MTLAAGLSVLWNRNETATWWFGSTELPYVGENGSKIRMATTKMAERLHRTRLTAAPSILVNHHPCFAPHFNWWADLISEAHVN